MNHAAALPLWLEGLIALLTVLGAAMALIGSIGLLRLRTFFERVHPPTMGTTLGLGLTLGASMLMFSVLESRPVLHEILIAVFMLLNTPVTYVLLVRAAVHRDSPAESSPAGDPEARREGLSQNPQHAVVGAAETAHKRLVDD